MLLKIENIFGSIATTEKGGKNMIRNLGKKMVAAALTATMLMSVVVPTAFAATPEMTSKKVRINAISDDILKVLEKKEAHMQSLEITDISFNIERDFDQSCYVTVKNTGTENAVFFLSVDNPYSDIYLGFIESGSATQPTLLTAGESTRVKLSVFAQRAEKDEYKLPVKAYIVDGVNDILDNEAEVTLNLPEETLNFTCDLTSSDEETLEQNYMITNNGGRLSSVSIYADDALDGYVTLTPGVSETPMNANESVNIRVTPNFTAMKEDNVSRVSGNIVVSAAGKEKKFSVVIDTQGKEIYSATMKDLITYQKSGKLYFNVSLDTQAVKDSYVFENNGSEDKLDENTNCKISYTVPFIDNNTGAKLAESENTVEAVAYNGNKPSGTFLNRDYSFNREEGILTVSYSVVISSEDIKYGIMSQLLKDRNDISGETEVNADEDENTANSRHIAKLFSEAMNSSNESGDASDIANDFSTWATRITDGTNIVLSTQQAFHYGIGVKSGVDNTTKLGKALKESPFISGDSTGTAREGFGRAYAWAGFASSAYSAYEHTTGTENFYKLDDVLNAPKIKVEDKERYVQLGFEKDAVNLGLGAIGILTLGLTGPIGWSIGVGLFVAGIWANKWFDDEMKEISDQAQGNGEDGEGGSDTYPNKRNQCTNAGKISAPLPNYPEAPEDPTSPPTEPPTAPTEPPTKPTEPPTAPPTNPTNPTSPTSPTSPTKPTEPATSKPPKKKWTFYLKASPEVGVANENVEIWTTAKNIDISQGFSFRFSYRKAGSWNWKDITNWTSSSRITTKFKKSGKYILRVVIKSNSNPNFWVGVEKDYYVNAPAEQQNSYNNNDEKEITFNPSHNMMLVTTRLQAGDESANDKVMGTKFIVSGKRSNSSTVSYLSVGKQTNNGCSDISMQLVDMSAVKAAMTSIGSVSGGGGGGNSRTSYLLRADYTTTPTHFRTVSDMEIVNYYPADTVINYVGNISNYRDVTLKSDFAVYEENIYVNGDFYVNEPTTLHCDVFNRNLAGGWADIVVKDGNDVIYSAEDVWIGRASSQKLEIPWTPTAKDSQISVKVTNKSMVTKEYAQDNNFAERKLTAIEYQVPEVGEIQNTLALENREFAVSSIIQKTRNITDVKMYMDGTEITNLQSSVNGTDIKKYWYNCNGLTAGAHNVKILATYEKAGGKFAIAEKSLDFNVISNAESSAVISKNSETDNTNLSADLYNGSNYSATYRPDESGDITVPFTTSMYQNTANYKVFVNTENGIYITELKAGSIAVNNSEVQNTFNVKGMSNIHHAILYIKDSDEYYTQLAYKYINCNARGVRVFYFDKAEYAQFAQAADAYLLCVTSDNKMHKLDIIKDGVRITDSNGSVEISDENIYQPVVSSAKAVGLIVANPVEGINSTVLKSSWNTSYQGKSNISVSAFGSELVSKPFINGKTVELPYNDYIVDYTLKSDNYVFEVEKELSLNSEGLTNRIENSFSGKISHQETAEVEETISFNAYDMTDKNGNMLKYVSAVRNKPVTVTVVFTDINDGSNVVKKTVKLNSFNGNIENVAVPDKAGDYKLSISMNLITETTMLGDLNSDEKINGTDVSLMKKFIYGVQTPTAKQNIVADIDGSGTIDKKDLELLKEMLA